MFFHVFANLSFASCHCIPLVLLVMIPIKLTVKALTQFVTFPAGEPSTGDPGVPDNGLTIDDELKELREHYHGASVVPSRRSEDRSGPQECDMGRSRVCFVCIGNYILTTMVVDAWGLVLDGYMLRGS